MTFLVNYPFKFNRHMPSDKNVICTQSCSPDDRDTRGVIDKVLIAVRGGSPATAVAMKSQLTKDGILDYTQYVEWAKTVSALPALIHSDVRHLHFTCQCMRGDCCNGTQFVFIVLAA